MLGELSTKLLVGPSDSYALVVVAESSIKCSKFLGHHFKKKNINVIPFYSDPYECIVKHPEFEKNSISMLSLYGSKKCRELFSYFSYVSNNQNYKPSPAFSELLDKYSHIIDKYVSFWKPMNGRFYYADLTRNNVLAYYEMLFEYYHEVFKKYRPKFVFDPDPNSFSRVVLQSVCGDYGIAYISFAHSRFKDYITVVNDFLSPGESLKALFCDQRCDSFLVSRATSEDELNKFRRSSSYLNIDEQMDEKVLAVFTLLSLLKKISSNVLFQIKLIINSLVFLKSFACISNPFYKQITPAGPLCLLYNVSLDIRKYIRIRTELFNSTRISDLPQDFVYYPFAYTAEGDSIFSRGIFHDDRNVFDLLALLRSTNQNIILKEHRSMLGERSFSESKYFSSWQKILYITSISRDFRDPKILLRSCKGTVTLSGTSGLESMLLQKPTLILGNPIYYDYLNLPSKYLPETSRIRQFLASPEDCITPHNCLVSYIQACMSIGVEVPFSALLAGDKNLDRTHSAEINKLTSLIIRLST